MPTTHLCDKGFSALIKIKSKTRKSVKDVDLQKPTLCRGRWGTVGQRAQLLQALFGLQQIFAVQQARPGIVSTVQ